ncbi:MAG: speG [Rickettsiales bacterium]|jgi:ribosomal-protein-alanine N-acetyltransferase|nr:speG [Rickettsiales bacterium]
MITSMPRDIFERFPVLDAGEGIVLRELVREDAPALFEYISHPEVQRFISDEDIPRTPPEAIRETEYWGGLFHQRQSIYWAIADRETNHLIGTCGFNFWNRLHKKGEISYDLARPLWGKGIMTRVLEKMIQFGFEEMQMHRISATVSPENPASIRVLDKLGFKHEGCMREYKIVHGGWEDAVMYAMLAHEYEARKK